MVSFRFLVAGPLPLAPFALKPGGSDDEDDGKDGLPRPHE